QCQRIEAEPGECAGWWNQAIGYERLLHLCRDASCALALSDRRPTCPRPHQRDESFGRVGRRRVLCGQRDGQPVGILRWDAIWMKGEYDVDECRQLGRLGLAAR